MRITQKYLNRMNANQSEVILAINNILEYAGTFPVKFIPDLNDDDDMMMMTIYLLNILKIRHQVSAPIWQMATQAKIQAGSFSFKLLLSVEMHISLHVLS